MKGIGFDEVYAAKDGATLTDLQNAGIQYQYTQPDGPYSMYEIGGHNVYVPGGTGTQPGDLNPAAQSYLAARSDPYLNPDDVAGYAFTGTPYGGLNYASATGTSAGAAAGSGPSGGTQQQRDALSLIKQTLSQYGLPDSLADWAWQELVAGKGTSEIMLDLQQRPEFKAAFPEIDARLQKGLAPLSPGDIVSYRQQARQVMAAAGLPSGFYDSKDDFTNFISNDMSINELTNRIDLAKQATFSIPPEVRGRLESEFGLTPGSGALTAYFLDDKKALPLLQRDFQAGQVGGAADRVGYQGVSNDTARQLVDLGVNEQQAQQGFGDLAQKAGLFEALPGQGEDTIDQQTQIGAEFGGNANAQRRIDNRQRKRLADFQGGGDFASSQNGLVGLGKANG